MKITITKQFAIVHANIAKILKTSPAIANRVLVFSSKFLASLDNVNSTKVIKFNAVAAKNDPRCAFISRTFEMMPDVARVLVKFLIRFKAKQSAATK